MSLERVRRWLSLFGWIVALPATCVAALSVVLLVATNWYLGLPFFAQVLVPILMTIGLLLPLLVVLNEVRLAWGWAVTKVPWHRSPTPDQRAVRAEELIQFEEARRRNWLSFVRITLDRVDSSRVIDASPKLSLIFKVTNFLTTGINVLEVRDGQATVDGTPLPLIQRTFVNESVWPSEERTLVVAMDVNEAVARVVTDAAGRVITWKVIGMTWAVEAYGEKSSIYCPEVVWFDPYHL